MSNNIVKLSDGNNLFTKKNVSILAVYIAAILAGTDSHAQSSGQAAEISEVLVTSRNRVESAQDVPLPVLVIGDAELRQENIVNIWDLPERIPNLQLNNPGENARKVSPGIRGLGRGGANDSMEQSVGVIVDDVTLYYSGQAWADYVDVERIEVLRGPQGTLLGKNTSLGAIKIVTKLPEFTPSSDLEVSVGDLNSIGGRFSSTGPILDNTLAYRSTFAVDRIDGLYENVYYTYGTSDGRTKEKWRETSKISGRLQLLWTPTPDLQGRFIVDKLRSDERVNTGNTIVSNGPDVFADGTPRPRLAPINFQPTGDYVDYGFLGRWTQRSAWFHNPDGSVYQPALGTTDIENSLARPQTTNQHGVSAQFEWTLGDYRLNSISAYRYQDFDIQNGSQSGIFMIGNGGQQAWNEQLSQELRIATTRGPVNYQAGLYYLDARVYSDDPSRYYQDAGAWNASIPDYTRLIATGTGRTLLKASLDHVWESSATDATVESLGIFGQADWDITDRFALSVGFRQTYEDKENRIRQELDRPGENLDALGAAINAPAAEIAAAKRTRSNSITDPFDWVEGKPIDASLQAWNVGLSYDLGDNTLVYSSVGSGVKAGFIYFRQGRQPDAADFETTIREEKSLDYALGFKSTLLNRRLQVNGNLYRTEVTDYQASWRREDPLDPLRTISGWGNAPKVLARGVEFDARYLIGGNFSFTLAGAYNKATYESQWLVQVPELASSNIYVDANGQQIANIPKTQFNAGVNYDIPLGRFNGRVSLSNSYLPAVYTNDNRSANTYREAYTLSNLNVSVSPADESWNLALLVRNVFDVDYANSLSTWSSTGAQTKTQGAPRFATLRFRTQF